MTHVRDGDTLELADGKRVRLWGIDAVEGSQLCRRDGRPWRCGDDATAALRRLIDGRTLACDARDVDRYMGAWSQSAASTVPISAPRWCVRAGRSTTSGLAAAPTLTSRRQLGASGRGCGRASSFRRGNGATRSASCPAGCDRLRRGPVSAASRSSIHCPAPSSIRRRRLGGTAGLRSSGGRMPGCDPMTLLEGRGHRRAIRRWRGSARLRPKCHATPSHECQTYNDEGNETDDRLSKQQNCYACDDESAADELQAASRRFGRAPPSRAG